MRALVVAFVALVLAAAMAPQAARAEFGLVPDSFKVATLDPAGQPELRAGAHPDRFTAAFDFLMEDGKVDANVKDVAFDLPAGFVGDPSAVPTCDRADLVSSSCPPESQIGVMRLTFLLLGKTEIPVYNVVPEENELAEFGGVMLIIPLRLFASLRTTGDPGMRIELRDLPQNLPLVSGEVELWGVPADHQTDTTIPRRPFLTNPTRCDAPPTTTIQVRSWQQPDRWIGVSSAEPGPLTGCQSLPFDPALGLALDDPAADSPTGATVGVTIPQTDDVNQPVRSHLKEVAVTLPAGMSLSPSVAAGLTACADDQFGIESTAAPACPESSKIGSVAITTPVLAAPMQGDVFFGRQLAPDTYRLFVTVTGPGFTLKLPGSLQADPATAQLTTVLTDLPQLPLSSIALHFKGGPRAPLATPPSCGTVTASARLTPYRGAPVPTVTAPVTIGSAPGGGACPAVAPFAPTFVAGSSPALAGASGAFSLTVRRPDGHETIDRLQIPLPAGLTARLAAVPRCPMAAATAAACSAASRVGALVVEAGPGANPFPLTGDVYLTDSYRGAPFGLALTLRAIAGPLDLGTVVVPATLRVDPLDGHLTIATDALPTILGGIPLRLQTLGIDIDRPGFLVNATSCGATRITASIRGSIATTATVTAPYSLRGCRGLRFRPKLAVSLTGKHQLHRGGHPVLSITMRQRAGDANVRSASITLPQAVALNEDAVSVICSRTRAAADRCPSGSRVGTARASTPLLSNPLTGSVYAVRPKGSGAPDLWAIVSGGGVRLTLRSATVAKKKKPVRSEFADLPDLPMSTFTLRLRGGRRGLLSAAKALCRGKRARRLDAHGALRGQNDARSSQTVRISARPRCRG